MNPHLRVTMVQADLAWQDANENRRRMARHFGGLSGHTDLIVLPEMFSTGYSMNAAECCEPMDGPTVGWMREESAALGCTITGSVIIKEDDRHYNRLIWVRPDGSLEYYDKRHLFRMAGEQKSFAAGERRLTVDIKGWRVCPLVCYDLRFPVWSRRREDYDILLYVASWPARRKLAWSTLLRARAIENVAYVVGVNRVGRDGNGADYCGGSVAIDFLGQPLNDEHDGDDVETVVLDRTALDAFRASFPVHLDADDFELRAVAR